MHWFSRPLEVPRRLRAIVRARESSVIVLALIVGTLAGLVIAAMGEAVALMHLTFFGARSRRAAVGPGLPQPALCISHALPRRAAVRPGHRLHHPPAHDRVNEAPSLRASLRVTTPHQQLTSCAEGSRHPETSLFRSVTLCEVPTAYFQAEAKNRMSNRRVFH